MEIRKNDEFELTIEDDGIGNCSVIVTNHSMPIMELIGALDVELHSLKEQAYHKTKFDRTFIYPDGRVMKIEDKKEGK